MILEYEEFKELKYSGYTDFADDFVIENLLNYISENNTITKNDLHNYIENLIEENEIEFDAENYISHSDWLDLEIPHLIDESNGVYSLTSRGSLLLTEVSIPQPRIKNNADAQTYRDGVGQGKIGGMINKWRTAHKNSQEAKTNIADSGKWHQGNKVLKYGSRIAAGAALAGGAYAWKKSHDKKVATKRAHKLAMAQAKTRK